MVMALALALAVATATAMAIWLGYTWTTRLSLSRPNPKTPSRRESMRTTRGRCNVRYSQVTAWEVCNAASREAAVTSGICR